MNFLYQHGCCRHRVCASPHLRKPTSSGTSWRVRAGDCTILLPGCTKSDPFALHFGDRPIYLPYLPDDPTNAVNRLQQLKLLAPSRPPPAVGPRCSVLTTRPVRSRMRRPTTPNEVQRPCDLGTWAGGSYGALAPQRSRLDSKCAPGPSLGRCYNSVMMMVNYYSCEPPPC